MAWNSNVCDSRVEANNLLPSYQDMQLLSFCSSHRNEEEASTGTPLVATTMYDQLFKSHCVCCHRFNKGISLGLPIYFIDLIT
jgi:mono/diheme cytochrome c family protein